MVANIIDKLKKTKKDFLKEQANSIELWKQLEHTKADLETFLQFHIAELRFLSKDAKGFKTIVCTSNLQLIAIFQALKEVDKKKALASISFHEGIRTKNSHSTLTFNLIDNKYNTISLRAWELGNFVTITPNNIQILDIILCDLLKRQKTDKKDDLLCFK